LLEGLGAKGVVFDEIVALDPQVFADLGTIYGVIFLFKWIASTGQTAEAPEDGSYDFDAENVFFAKQTIQNACGTQALLNILLNLRDEKDLEIGTALNEFVDFTLPLPADVSF
jgi:ubiquitin carboxyl-terminal hydrolase L5